MDSHAANGLIYVVLIVIAYCIPWIVAASRHHNDRLAIIMINLLAGWTVLGWLIALIWACTGNVQHSEAKAA